MRGRLKCEKKRLKLISINLIIIEKSCLNFLGFVAKKRMMFQKYSRKK
jgi:hypothetical protein